MAVLIKGGLIAKDQCEKLSKSMEKHDIQVQAAISDLWALGCLLHDDVTTRNAGNEASRCALKAIGLDNKLYRYILQKRKKAPSAMAYLLCPHNSIEALLRKHAAP